MQTLTVGSKAPMFTLNNQHGQSVSLASLLEQGQVLVYFYPKAMTPGCTVQACGIRDNFDKFQANHVSVVAISPDPVKSLAKFAERDQLPFILLSDEDHQVADAFGVWGSKKFMGKVYDGIHRISFLLAQDGTVVQVFDSFKTSNHHQVVLDALGA